MNRGREGSGEGRGGEERRQRWREKWKREEWMAEVTAWSNLDKMRMIVRKSNSHPTYFTNADVSNNFK